MAAPGVTFAPAAPGTATKVRPDSELDGWRPPPPRRTTSQRVRRQPSSGGGKGEANGAGGGLSRHRSGDRKKGESISAAAEIDGVPVPTLPATPGVESNGVGEQVKVGDRTLDAGERRGVTLEDRPLSRNASQGLKRTASQWKKAAQKAFEPLPKEEGEKRVIVLVADGTEEIEVMTAYDVFVRASLNPVLVSVSPQFSPSNSLPHITLSRGARILADTQFETLKEEHWDLFDAVVVPGGAKGAERLSKEKRVQELLWRFWSEQKLVGCICAGACQSFKRSYRVLIPFSEQARSPLFLPRSVSAARSPLTRPSARNSKSTTTTPTTASSSPETSSRVVDRVRRSSGRCSLSRCSRDGRRGTRLRVP